jgi:hypothetical protein
MFLHLLCFFFYKIREQEGRTGSEEMVGTSGRGEVGKRVEDKYGVNNLYVCMYKW